MDRQKNFKRKGYVLEGADTEVQCRGGNDQTHQKQLEACWKKFKSKHKAQDATDRKELFRTGGGPAPPDSLQEAPGSQISHGHK